MRKLIVLILLAVLVPFSFTGCGGKSFPEVTYDIEKIDPRVPQRSAEFGLNIFRQLNTEDQDQSVFISPLSIATALTMTYQGAGGTTKEAMASTLNYKGIDMDVLNESCKNLLRYLQQADDNIELSINNSIWIKKGEAVNQGFINANSEVFDAYVSELDFSQDDAAGEINRWIDEATKGKIDRMLEPPIPADVVMYLINAIYFRGEWAEQFDKKNTFGALFQNGDGSTADVMMMSKKGRVDYAQGDDHKVIRLDYGSGKTSMYLVLPIERPVNKFIADMTLSKWQSIKKSLAEEDEVLVQIPRFKLEYGIKELNDSLSALGMAEAFTGSADFSGIREGIFISRVLHKAVIEVNEEGSEAAGVTVVEMVESAAADPTTFIADRPFMFVIEENETGTILFMGKLWEM